MQSCIEIIIVCGKELAKINFTKFSVNIMDQNKSTVKDMFGER
jgi:hypothetical protein